MPIVTEGYILGNRIRTRQTAIMSGRRACYKCGNLGHFAEVCTSAERLCYNCEWDSLFPDYPDEHILTLIKL